MREAVYISYGFRMRASPLSPQNALKTKMCFWAFFQKVFVYSFGEPLGLWFHGATVGPYNMISKTLVILRMRSEKKRSSGRV